MLPWTRWGCESVPVPANQPIVHLLLSDHGFFALIEDYATREVDNDVIYGFFMKMVIEMFALIDIDDYNGDIDDGYKMAMMMLIFIMMMNMMMGVTFMMIYIG